MVYGGYGSYDVDIYSKFYSHIYIMGIKWGYKSTYWAYGTTLQTTGDLHGALPKHSLFPAFSTHQ